MADYKSTLNLPQTDFPMKASLAEREPHRLRRWEAIHLYQQIRDKNKGKKKFILLDGPPYANGHIHLGHAVNKILKDVVVKFKTLSGFDAPFIPAWDCHGLPIEVNVEKKFGKPGEKLSPHDFRLACRDYAASFVDIQREEFKRLGVVADWEHPVLTMDFTYEAEIIRSVAKVLKNGYITKGYKPVFWCLDCQSSLAEAEVEYADKSSTALDVRYFISDVDAFYARFKDHVKRADHPVCVPIWTTTPWTLPASQAVTLNPNEDYVLVSVDNREQILVANALLPLALYRYGISDHEIMGTVRGEDLQGLTLHHPFYEKHLPIVTGEHVTVDVGTGAVHTAPAHGTDDYEMSKQHHISIESLIMDNGCFKDNLPYVGGLHVSKAEEAIIAALEEHNTLIRKEVVKHSYPHCWRHKTALILRATPQWFVSMAPKQTDHEGLRQKALAAIPNVTWYPSWGSARMAGMMQEGRPDWCISRQRTWGTPLPLFIHKETGELHPDTVRLMEEVASLVEKSGTQAWHQLDLNQFLGADAQYYTKDTDVLDVWFESGVSPECMLQKIPDLAFPSDLVLEGSDQYRGWFQSQLLTSLAINDVVPYKAVITHGFVVDKDGKKMSKSLGNVIAPEEIVKTLGADILRLWVTSIDYQAEIVASKEILANITEMYRRIRNTVRFLLANLHGFDPAKHLVADKDLLALDQYILDRAQQLQKEIINAYDHYSFHSVVQKVHQFCLLDLGGFYLDIIKDRQYTMAKESVGRRSAQTALYHLVSALVRWIAPILTFTAEEIWHFIPRASDLPINEAQDSVLLTTWYENLPNIAQGSHMDPAFWEVVKKVREAVNKEIENARDRGEMGSALEAEVALYCDPTLYAALSQLKDELRFVLLTSKAEIHRESQAGEEASLTEVPGLRVKIVVTHDPKCERCWHRSAHVNEHAQFPQLCERCVENVSGPGEVRHYA